jgi:hypothetical protein
MRTALVVWLAVFLLPPLARAGNASLVEATSLGPILDADKVLGLFRDIPSKENGVDIEGIAVDGDDLYAGFRGPVLRGNFTPVLRFRFANPSTATELLFVDLGGLGIRDLTKVRGGFLILAGPVGDGPGGYHLFFWDGRDCLPGLRTAGARGRVRPIGEVRPPPRPRPRASRSSRKPMPPMKCSSSTTASRTAGRRGSAPRSRRFRPARRSPAPAARRLRALHRVRPSGPESDELPAG